MSETNDFDWYRYAVDGVTSGLANAVLAGVNPVHGMYTVMIATPIGALLASSVFMNIDSTSAIAVTAGNMQIDYPAETRWQALVVLTLLVGACMLVVGLLELGAGAGAGIGRSYRNLDGNYPDTSRDFVGQGVANVAGGALSGPPGRSQTVFVYQQSQRATIVEVAPAAHGFQTCQPDDRPVTRLVIAPMRTLGPANSLNRKRTAEDSAHE